MKFINSVVVILFHSILDILKILPFQKIDLLIISIKFFNWKRRARIEIMRKEKINGSKISKRIKLKEKSTNP